MHSIFREQMLGSCRQSGLTAINCTREIDFGLRSLMTYWFPDYAVKTVSKFQVERACAEVDNRMVSVKKLRA